jgi:ribonuclease III
VSEQLTELEPILSGVEELLGYKFKDRSILFQALCHRSYVYEQDLPPIESNERLEFLGDSVVELAVTTVLYEDFPDFLEGELTKLRSPLVRGKALAEIAQQLGIDKYVLLGKGEEMTGGREKQSILADTFEAVVGALYVDGGFDVARGFVISSLERLLHEIVKWGAGDYKSELQELSTKRKRIVPRYRIKDEGPDHFKTFHATVDIGGDLFGPVAGSSKKEAEQGAARLALLKLGWREESEEGRHVPPARAGERPAGARADYGRDERVVGGASARPDEAAGRLGRWWRGLKRGG